MIENDHSIRISVTIVISLKILRLTNFQVYQTQDIIITQLFFSLTLFLYSIFKEIFQFLSTKKWFHHEIAWRCDLKQLFMSLREGTYARNPDEALYRHSLFPDKPWQDGETKWEACVVIKISVKQLVALGQNASHVMSRRPAGRNIRNALQLKRTWIAINASCKS